MFNSINYEIAKEIVDFLEPAFLHVSSGEDIAEARELLLSLKEQAGKFVLPSDRILNRSSHLEGYK